MPQNVSLKGKIALVTGSTDGVGRRVARQLAGQGARVLIHGRNADRGKELVEQIRAARGSAIFLPADFSSLAEVRRLADVVARECDRLDLLINNAGIGSGGSAGKRETSQDGYEAALRSQLPSRIPAHEAVAACCDAQQTSPRCAGVLTRPASDQLR